MELGADMIAQLGVSAAIAIFLVYFLTQQLSAKVDKLGENMEKQTNTITFLAIVIAEAQGIDVDSAKRMAGLSEKRGA